MDEIPEIANADSQLKEDKASISGEGQKEMKKDRLLYWSLAFIFAVIILFFASSRYFGSSEPENPSIEYNNWVFTKIAGLWWFEWQKGDKLFQIPLRFNPIEAESVPIIGALNLSKFNAESYVYITFDFSDEGSNVSQNFTTLALAASELSQNLATAINRVPIAACVNNNSKDCFQRPVKTCENTDEPVIYLREGGNASIILQDSCIIVTGEDFDVVRAVDRLLYHWYGIIQQS